MSSESNMINESEGQAERKAAGNEKRNSTSDVPMVSLPEVVEFIRTIHENGLERAPMPAVAKGTGYANASSTPFYRRISASRLFTLVLPRGADLTELGQDCIRPTSEDATHQALLQAIQSVDAYSNLLMDYNGKRVNITIITHWFERKHGLNNAAASACAKAFVESLRYAGCLSADNLVTFSSENISPAKEPISEHKIVADSGNAPSAIAPAGAFKFEIILNPQSSRKFTIITPPSVTTAELKRIQDWLSFQLLVEDEAKNNE